MSNLDIALRLAQQGLFIFPCCEEAGHGQVLKAPKAGMRWSEKSTNEAKRIHAWWGAWQRAIIGIDLRKSGLVVLDGDCHHDGQNGIASLQEILGSDFAMAPHAFTPNGGVHVYFRQPHGHTLGNRRGSLPPDIDVRGAGGYVISPGSVLPDGRQWQMDGDIALAVAPTLPDHILARILDNASEPSNFSSYQFRINTLGSCSRYGAYARRGMESELAAVASATPGTRNHTLNRAAFNLAQMVSAGWLNEDEAGNELMDAARQAGLGGREAMATIRSGFRAGSTKPRPAPAPVPRGEAREDQWFRKIIEGRSEKMDAQNVQGPNDFNSWNPWTQYVGPRFPLETLPVTLSEWATERSRLVGCDISAYAMTALALVGASADHRISLIPKKGDSKYKLHPSLWIALVGDPSVRKSAPIGDAAGFMLANDRRDHEDMELERQAADDPESVPASRRRVVTDTTVEQLCNMLAHQDCGITLINDELSSWIDMFDKYNGNGSHGRAIWLQAFDGGKPYIQDRIKGSRRVNNLSCGVIGAIQPERLSEMGNLVSDGLLQRFLPVVMKDAVDEMDFAAPTFVHDRMDRLLYFIGKIAPTVEFHLTDAARSIYMEFSSRMGKMVRTIYPSPAFGGFCGKQGRSLGVIALLLHLVDIAENRLPMFLEISAETMSRALKIMQNFVLPHASAFYQQLDSKTTWMAKSIAVTVIRHAGGEVTLRNLMHSTRALRTISDKLEIQRRLQPFLNHGWLVPVQPHPGNNRWTVPVELKGMFAREIEEQEARIRQIQSQFETTAD